MSPDSSICFNAYTNKYCIHQNHFLLVLLASTKFTTKLVNILSLTTLSLILTWVYHIRCVVSLYSGGEGECSLDSKVIIATRNAVCYHTLLLTSFYR